MFNTITEIIDDLKSGRMVIVVDDEGRENEGDLIAPAESIKPQDINFMATFGKGLICVAMEKARLDDLGLHILHNNQGASRDPYSTAWTISVDASQGITTGISAFDRAHTVGILINKNTKPQDLVRPGHLFPLQAKEGGVLVRAGHTEAAVDLMKISGLYPAGVICEIINEDGTMARIPDLLKFSKKHNLKICTIASLIEHRRRYEKLVERVANAKLPTEFGEFDLYLYESSIDRSHHIALVYGRLESPTLVRVHSACLTGDVFGSIRCDCGRQLNRAFKDIAKEGSGIILYMNQEGRGIGLKNKIFAYHKQDQGLDTVEANEALGFPADLRDYGIGAQILVDLGVKELKLLTNNPRKIIGLEGYGLKVVERLAIKVKPNPANKKYLKTKKDKLGHIL
ncbi:MAG: bifunctional 3,4-dihydroxy-2-butanone-4-phosphate synthase/GTP cyclohydrolase II [Candidatus Omnitrophota bacterium]